jgi:hypothetical protein
MNRVPVDQVRNISVRSLLRPLSYHYITPHVMRVMHDDIYTHGMPLRRSRGLPKILHQARGQMS